MYIGKTPTVGNFQVCDAISVVNGQAAYTLQVGGTNVAPESANHMLVSLNGILQKPGSSFTISGSTMTFASNLATGDVIDFVQILGNVLDIGQPSDDTVTAAKLNNDIISGQTALTSAPASTDELLISDAGTIKRIDAQFFQNTPAFHAFLSANQEGNSDAATVKVNANSETYDSGTVYDNSSNYRFTPGVAGKYFIYGAALLAADATANMREAELYIYKNGSNIGKSSFNYVDQYSQNATPTISIVDVADDNDYYELYAHVNTQNSGAFKILADSTQQRTYFGAYKIIGV